MEPEKGDETNIILFKRKVMKGVGMEVVMYMSVDVDGGFT